MSAHHVRNNVSLITLLQNRTCTLFLTAPRAVLLPPTNHIRYSSDTSVCEHPLLSPPCAPSVTTFYHLLLTPHFFVPLVHFCHHLLSPPLPWPLPPTPPKRRTHTQSKLNESPHIGDVLEEKMHCKNCCIDILVNHLQRQQPDLAPIRLEPQDKKLIKPKSTGWDCPTCNLASGFKRASNLSRSIGSTTALSA